MNVFQNKLKVKVHAYIEQIYRVTKNFPADELYGVTSQLRRSALSVMLNYIEGFGRQKSGYKLQFYENSYASLKESKYLVFFSYTQHYLKKEDYDTIILLSEDIGRMLWSEMQLFHKAKLSPVEVL